MRERSKGRGGPLAIAPFFALLLLGHGQGRVCLVRVMACPLLHTHTVCGFGS